MGKEIDNANNLLSIPGILDALASDMCDHYCKWPETICNEDELIERYCNDGPLVRWL